MARKPVVSRAKHNRLPQIHSQHTERALHRCAVVDRTNLHVYLTVYHGIQSTNQTINLFQA